MSPSTAAFGSWRSPITADSLARGRISFWEVTSDRDDVYWGEFRPAEGSRIAALRRTGSDIAEIAPGFNARTLVHEYGGASIAVRDGVVVASRFDDQRMYRFDGPERVAITPEPPSPRAIRYADGVIAGGSVVAVQEDHTGAGEPVNRIVRVGVDGTGDPEELVGGRDFFAWPRMSPDGARLAWIAWDHPNMPWDETELWVGDFSGGRVRDPRKVLGGTGESVVQPVWSPSGDLHAVADGTGWWNLYRIVDGTASPLVPGEREHAVPAWLFGASNYGFLSDGRIVCTWAEAGLWSAGVIDDGALRRLDLGERRAISGRMAIAGGRAFLVAGGPAEPMSLMAIDPDSGEIEVIRRAEDPPSDPGFVSIPRPLEIPTSDGETAYAFHYLPANPDFEGPEGERPPLLVFGHGGPTAQTLPVFSREIQFWTSRGFSVVDVNYRGSTGYGRRYRDALRGRWGSVDVADCVDAARHLAATGAVDGERLAIRGGSAGGYVTLCALVFHDVFRAGTSYCGIADIRALMETTHKFESRYDSTLVGPLPEAESLYHDRSPINFADRVSCPILIIQGSEDTVVTPDQAEVFVEALRDKEIPHRYMLIEGEDHFLSKAETKVDTQNAELSFYGQIFGFEPAGEVPRLDIAFLG